MENRRQKAKSGELVCNHILKIAEIVNEKAILKQENFWHNI